MKKAGFIILSAILFLSCSNNDNTPDVSKIKAEVNIKRFEQDFFLMDTNNLQASLHQLRQKHPSFAEAYINFLTPIMLISKDSTDMIVRTREYISNLHPLYDSVQKKYKNLNWLRDELSQAFKYIKYYVPSFKVPDVYTSVEGFNPDNPDEIKGVAYGNDTLVISLQMFMGRNFSFYSPQHYYDYLRRRFEREFITRNSVFEIGNYFFPEQSGGKPLIEQMIEKGKHWWLLSHFMPKASDSIITGYTDKQVEWCNENEGDAWAYLLQNEDLYSREPMVLQTYLGDAPKTQTMPDPSPGNIGQWIGWRIVQKFTEKNPSLTLEQVMQTDAKKIFEGSKYKPK